jgi:MFS family permease
LASRDPGPVLNKPLGGLVVFQDNRPVDLALADVMSDVEDRRARKRRTLVTFWSATFFGAGAGAAIGATLSNLVMGLAIGLFAGAVLGVAVCAVMVIWPVVRMVWHWLAEILAAATLTAAVSSVVGVMGSWWWAAVFAVPVGLGATLRPVRRRVLAVVWCAVVRHRLRVCFASFIRARNRLHPALAPLVLLARPTPAGERVWVWLRAGLDVAELETHTGKMAVACWASEVQVSVSRRYAALVRIDVTRRDPLRLLVASPLAARVPGQRASVEPDAAALAILALDLDDVPVESVVDRAGRR